MKKLLSLFVFTLAVSTFASTYDCKIAKEDLPFSADMDLDFVVSTGADTGVMISILGDDVSEYCELVSDTVVTCDDAEGMPHVARIISDSEVTLTIGRGMFLPETKAECTKN